MAYARLVTKEQRLSSRYMPKGAVPVWRDPAGDSAIYGYDFMGKRGQMLCALIAYWGSSSKPLFHRTYRDASSWHDEVKRFRTNVEATHQRKADKTMAAKAWKNPLKTGQILYTSWGYDQTNVDFYVITRVSGSRVYVRPIAQDSETTSYMAGHCWPKMPIEPCGPETAHTARWNGCEDMGASVSINGHAAWLEQGRSHGFSTYA